MEKEELSDFMKYVLEKGEIKEVDEAFLEFPVEEEYHKGKIENILCENKEEYTTYSVGDIVFVKTYMYKNGNLGNNHLFVIIDRNNIAVPIENIGMIISSKDVVYKISDNQILFKIGEVSLDKVEEYKKCYTNL